MFHALKHSRTVWLLVGLIAGLILGGFWPHTPLHAVATDRNDTFAIATGPLDDEVEAVFFLDFLTGNLRAVALNKFGQFNAFYEYNVLKDLGVTPAKNPRFLMVTGIASLQRVGPNIQPGRSIVYVAEVTTGNMVAYYLPWNTAMRSQARPTKLALIPLDATKFRAAAGGGAGVGIAPGGP